MYIFESKKILLNETCKMVREKMEKEGLGWKEKGKVDGSRRFIR